MSIVDLSYIVDISANCEQKIHFSSFILVSDESLMSWVLFNIYQNRASAFCFQTFEILLPLPPAAKDHGRSLFRPYPGTLKPHLRSD